MNNLIKQSLKEDIGSGDITTDALIPKDLVSKAKIIAKENGVIAGLKIAKEVFKQLDAKIKFNTKLHDGDKIFKGTIIAEIRGSAKAILKAERTALNFLQRLSGIATTVRKFADKAKGTNVKILDTRKTTPLHRMIEKDAVKAGGGFNHRMGLYDQILIKDNHLAIIKDVEIAVKKTKKCGKVEVEVKSIKELESALTAKADIILLDNMPLKKIRESVTLIHKWNKMNNANIKIEASGGINLGNVRSIAKAGVDYISVGALTHSAKAVDISLKIAPQVKFLQKINDI